MFRCATLAMIVRSVVVVGIAIIEPPLGGAT
jgi:hypothetical protein